MVKETPSALYPDASKRGEVKWVEARGTSGIFSIKSAWECWRFRKPKVS